ncbi:chromate efflux transporter [Zhongshania aliphaticivorans]|uniref:chromate efflux transporter n=1 Tax=Zhongshania aliphaticivorans TaxID=1470434 RepID=UPI0012E5F2F9|nr:chromate efflux transporter [Zhongshania aliphaticivorans]CAA0102070.1 putative chromate transport protein [Zhongshania aliphaticivorans]
MVWRVFLQFLYLGCVSFGGPAAHIGYFRKVFVEQKAWLSEQEFAADLALCQFLPGPSSSQLGYAIACRRGGIPAGIVAFLGFTLPSFLLMYGLAVWQLNITEGTLQFGIVSGLKLLAVAVVADAVWGMANQFCRQPPTIALAVISTATLTWAMTPLWQFSLMALAAAVMAWRAEPAQNLVGIKTDRTLLACLTVFVLLFVVCLVFPDGIFATFYKAGSLVFGGGHVVLPLLEPLVGEALSKDQFLLGYAAAQAVPGPMFSLSAYLGAAIRSDAALLYAFIATLAVFAPGFLLLSGVRGIWQQLSTRPRIVAAIAGVNAVAVGMLAAAWINPVASSAPTIGLPFYWRWRASLHCAASVCRLWPL